MRTKIERILEKHDVVADTDYEVIAEEILLLFSVVGRSEQLKVVEELVDFARDVTNVCDLDRLEEILDRL